MKVSKVVGCWGVTFGLVLAGLLLAGCGKTTKSDFSDVQGLTPGSTGPAVGGTAGTTAPVTPAASGIGDLLKPGESLTITFTDLLNPVSPFDVRIKEDDGTITLMFSQVFVATNKTRGDLEKEIRAAYVPKYFKNLTVNVAPKDQFFFVGGEVRSPNRFPYIGTMTVLNAIRSAGDFTDFAKKTQVVLTRADGRSITIDCKKAIRKPALDLPVYPGDKIHVPRRVW